MNTADTLEAPAYGPVNAVVKLGKSDKWVSENGKKRLAELLRLVGEGDNGIALGA